jgi:hypothetical protein
MLPEFFVCDDVHLYNRHISGGLFPSSTEYSTVTLTTGICSFLHGFGIVRID